MKTTKELALEKIAQNIQENKVNVMVSLIETRTRTEQDYQKSIAKIDNDIEKLEKAETIDEIKALSGRSRNYNDD